MTYEQSQEKFIAAITDIIFPGNKCSKPQKSCFQLRFRPPKNWQQENVEIAEKMHEEHLFNPPTLVTRLCLVMTC